MYHEQLEIPPSGLICNLTIPNDAKSMVIFVHGRGSNRFSTRNQTIARYLNEKRYATALVDLLNVDEQSQDSVKAHLRFDIDLLTERLVVVTKYLCENDKTNSMTIGYFGSSTGAAAAINASSVCDQVKTLVLRGGRTDLVKVNILESIDIPSLYIAGHNDKAIIQISQRSLNMMSNCKSKQLVVIPGASHEFNEPGKINEVAVISGQWLDINLLKEDKTFSPAYGSSNLKQKFYDCLKKRSISLVFDDRISSATILSNILDKYKSNNDVTVIAIPRGGILLANVIASKLTRGNFNILVSVRLRNPHFSEKTIGSILQDGTIYLTSECNQFSSDYLDMEIKHQKKVLDDLKQFYKIDDEDYRLRDKTVILLDDGSYSGSTIINACSWVKNKYPRKIIIGIPVISKNAFELLDDPIVKIEYIYKPKNFYSVEKYYRDFSLPKSEELLKLIDRRPY
jgi:predicted phosphoribosyltransferase/pimeloyl-ACP methyl ester carboxylesterase